MDRDGALLPEGAPRSADVVVFATVFVWLLVSHGWSMGTTPTGK